MLALLLLACAGRECFSSLEQACRHEDCPATADDALASCAWADGDHGPFDCGDVQVVECHDEFSGWKYAYREDALVGLWRLEDVPMFCGDYVGTWGEVPADCP